MSSLWILLDLIVVAIMALCAFLSAKRGFVRTVVELVGFILALYLAFTVSGAVANTLYNNTIEPAIVNTVTENVTNTAAVTVDDTVNAVWEGLPAIVSNSASFFGVEASAVSDTINNQLSNTSDVSAIAQTVAQKAVQPVVVPLIKSVLGTVLFIILMFVVKIFARLINRVFKLPLIGGINRLLGGILGLGKGLVISAIICIAISTLIAITGKEFLFFTKENIENSLLFGLLANISLF